MDKKDEETHAMDKPKPLEVVSDGDLSEVKKDPVWKTWLKEKAGSLPERTEDDIVTDRQGKKDTKRESEQRYEDKLSEKKRRIFSPHKAKDPKAMIATDEQKLRRAETAQADLVDANRKQAKHSKHVKRVRDAKWIEDFRARNTSRKTPSKGKFSIGELGPSGKPSFGTPEHKKIIQETTDDVKREYYKLNPARTKPSKREHKRLFPDQYYASGAKKRKKKAWEVWLDKISPSHNTHRGSNWHTGDEYSCPTCARKREKKPEYDEEKAEATVSDSNKTYVTKPIPDSKGGRGSFQHCIDANQDKNNPGGWCKQIERKIGKAKKQTKIDKPKDWWDHSKVGRQGDIDQKTGRPWWEVATEEKERRKREAKEKTDYFVEEIRSNIIYHNKVFPLIGMIAGQAARGLGKLGKKVGSEVLEGAGQVGQHMMEQEAQDEEEQ